MRNPNAIRAAIIRLTQRLDQLDGQTSTAAVNERKALNKKLDELGLELADSLDAEAEGGLAPDAAGIEHAGLVAASNSEGGIGTIVAALRAGSQTDGATAELQQAHGLPSDSIPLDLLRPRMAVTPGVATGVNERPTVQPVFAVGDMMHFGLMTDTVAAGDQVYPVLTNRPSVGGPHTDSTSVAETTGQFSAINLAPERSQAAFFYRRTDASRFAQMGEALRVALVDSMGEDQDKLLHATLNAATGSGGLGNAVDLASGVATFADIQKLAGSNVDGRFARRKADIKVLLGGETFAFADALYQSNGDDSAAMVLNRESGGIDVSAQIAARTGGGKKQDALIRVGMRQGDYASAMWQGVHMIYDEISKASTGEIQLTAVWMTARKLLRASGFKRMAVQVAA